MMRRLSATTNGVLARVAPARSIFIKSETRTRHLRLSPVSQIAGGVVAIACLGWAGFAAYHISSNHDLTERLVDADAKVTALYEARIAALIEDKRRLADSLSEANMQIAEVSSALTERHAALGAAIAAEEQMEISLAVKRAQIDAVTTDLEQTADAHAGAAEKLQSADAQMREMKRAEAEAHEALAALTAVLDATTAERNTAALLAADLGERVETLEDAFAQKRDQQERLVARLEDAARLSLGSLENVFAKTGVDVDPIISAVRRDYSGEGGMFIPAPDDAGFASDPGTSDRIGALMSDMERISALRIAVDKLPVSRPVGAARFTSGYGGRKDPFNGRRSFHGGIDWAAPRGTPIYATGSGEVVFSGWQGGYGKVIKIRHAFGYETVYAHLNRRRVNVGDRVERGDRIGDMGNTGRSSGSHLHYEIRVNGKTINPAKYIEAARNVL